MEKELNNKINFLDLQITISNQTISFDIYRKPTATDHAININSYHPCEHKISTFHYLINRLIQIPLSKFNYNKELNHIIQLAIVNGFNKKIILNLLRKKRFKMRNKIDSTLNEQDPNNNKKYFAMTYLKGISNKLGSFFKKENINIAYQVNNNIKTLINNNINNESIFNKNGIYKLTCKTCRLPYIGRTKRTFKERYKEHVADFKYKREKSNFAKHLINSSHELDTIENTMKIIKTNHSLKTLNTAEEYYINKEHKKTGKIINEIITNQNNPLFDIPV